MDCMEGMAQFLDKFFDLAIVDPPYGIGIVSPGKRSLGNRKNRGVLTSYKPSKWNSATPSKEYFDELFRVSKNQIIWGGNYFTDKLPPSKGWVVWDKHQPDGVSFAQAELAYTSFNISAKIFECSRAEIGNTVGNNKRLAKVNSKIHPTQKPVLLYRWLLKKYGKQGDIILDTHAGSCSSLIACMDMGFKYLAFELDPDYCQASLQRIETFKSQLKLF